MVQHHAGDHRRLEEDALVIRHGVGYDNVDLEALGKAGIAPCYIPDYCAEEVAEQAIALIMACGRRVVSSRKVLDDSSARGLWDFTPMIPVFRMAGQTLGILGCGRIGSRVYQKLRSFGFKFLICDPYLTEERKRELGIETVDKETMFRRLRFRHHPHAAHLGDAAHRERRDAGDDEAHRLPGEHGARADGGCRCAGRRAEARRDRRRGIDVFDLEPPPPDYPLFPLPNAILTPHLAWYSEDAAWTIRELIVLEVDRFLAGQPPRYMAKKTS